MNGLQAPATTWPQGFIPSSRPQRFPTQAERRYADTQFEKNLDSVLSPRFEYTVGISASSDPPLTTRTAAQVQAYSRIDLEEELLRVQLQRDDLRDRLLREREVKAVEAKQWKNRAQQAQEMLVAERRAKAALQERVDELEQVLASTYQRSAASAQNHSNPTTFAFENSVLLRENGVSGGGIGGGDRDAGNRAAAAFAAEGAAVTRREEALQRTPPPTPQAMAIWSPEHSAHAQHIQHTPSKQLHSSSAAGTPQALGHTAHNNFTPGKVASLVGNFNPPAQRSSGSLAPHSTPTKHLRAQSEPRSAYQNHLHSGSLSKMGSGALEAVLAPTASPSKGFGKERLVRIPRGEGGGVGLRFGITSEGKVFVTEVMAGATAARFGQLRVSDEILEVDGVAVAGGVLAGLRAGSDPISHLSRLIRGPAGSILALRILSLPPASSSAPADASPPQHPPLHSAAFPSASPRPIPHPSPSSPPPDHRSDRVLSSAQPPGRQLEQTRMTPESPQAGSAKGSALGYWRRLEAASSPPPTSTPGPGPTRASASPGPGRLGPSGSAQLQHWRGASALASSRPDRTRAVSAGPGGEASAGNAHVRAPSQAERDDGSACRFLF